MGFSPAALIGGSSLAGGLFRTIGAAAGLASLLGGKKQKATPSASVSTSPTADDVAKEDERRRLLSRGLTPLTATSPLGDTTAANLGRKALLGQ